MSLLKMVYKVTNELDNNSYSVGVFMDLSNTFDIVDHHLIANKLYLYGIRRVAFNWFVNYIALNNQMSAKSLITGGVPQGSILGPLLFMLFINNIVNTSKITEFISLLTTQIYFLNIKMLKSSLTLLIQN